MIDWDQSLKNNLVDRVIGLNADDNMICVYRAEQVPFRHMQDLAGVILSSPPTAAAKEPNGPSSDREADQCQA